MSVKHRRPTNDYELLPRDSLDEEAKDLADTYALSTSWLSRLAAKLRITRFPARADYAHYVTPRRRKRSILRLIYWAIFSFPYICAFLVLFASIFMPSYTVRPPHYNELRKRATQDTEPGRANPYGEKVFIAASLYEEKGSLTTGAWGQAVLDLIDLLGPDNVHLSLYEDNPDLKTKQALAEFRQKIPSNSTIVAEDLDLSTLPHITLPNGEQRLKRIAFLANVRNRALAPIDSNGVKFDKVLFLNDVIFDPVDATQLLFATNIDSTGRANYAAACAVDFINAFKFYDRFATRGFDMDITGIPFFPWFTSAGRAISRNDVLSQTDAVRVRSCWSGMVAYEARWFQDQNAVDHRVPTNTSKAQDKAVDILTSPLKFRYDKETFWEASECCLINADLQYRQTGKALPSEPRIFMNPYIRVAYDERTLSWLSLTRRPERLYSLIHDILNKCMGMPDRTNRMTEEPGTVVTDTWWVYDDPVRGLAPNATTEDFRGHWAQVDRVAEPASIICVDLIIRQFPGKKNFKIEDSNVFLSTGLSLSFGVMIFSSLYSMLPSAKKYLEKGNLSPRAATLTLMGCFLVGALGISILSQILHQYIPHSVVDCDHEHGDEEEGKLEDEEAEHSHHSMREQMGGDHQEGHSHRSYGTHDSSDPTPPARRPSLHTAISSKVSQLVTGSKKYCDEYGQCFGYSDTCGTECFKNALTTRAPRLHTTKSSSHLSSTRPSGAGRSHTTAGPHERQPLLQDVDETAPLQPTTSGPATLDGSVASLASTNGYRLPNGTKDQDHTSLHKHSRSSSPSASTSSHSHSHHSHDHTAPQHHHHVPTNVFLSIGLQTSTAIALHKIPEGFITYATNHANPTLGFSIFLALFIHNITEGFALALPLYLAINSRWKAMFWSALLGGVSQPLGAGVAALSFRIAGRGKGEDELGDRVYGCMFAVTAGIMAMVSLQLLGESLDLTHSRRLCFVSAFCGMGILGLSSALTA
ncbi:cryptococcal mannosyltransferase 1-domain-containing protein [Paraphoma chrysanthemicola]|nr:cryptococcal mannosyltransferase 1-domain-containing protein [Paraphoma chrysanthemicola]